MERLSWDQFNGWRQYSEQEPWGDEREDQRTLALAAWIKAPGEWQNDLPALMYPYFDSTATMDLMAQKKVLDQRALDIKEKRSAQRERETLAGG
jgi:hypothetical protein